MDTWVLVEEVALVSDNDSDIKEVGNAKSDSADPDAVTAVAKDDVGAGVDDWTVAEGSSLGDVEGASPAPEALIVSPTLTPTVWQRLVKNRSDADIKIGWE